MPSQADKKDPEYCLYHLRKGHAFEQCVAFMRIFDKKLQDRETILQNQGGHNVREQPFLNHNNGWGKCQVMMVSASEKSIAEDVPM